jgi:hypothetical protein
MTAKTRAIPALHREHLLAKEPGQVTGASLGNTTSPYCRAVSTHGRQLIIFRKFDTMKKYLRYPSILLFACLLLFSFGSIRIEKKENFSIIAISCVSSGPGAKGIGIEMVLLNIDTQEKLKSKSLSVISSHSYIQNVPPGRYIVSQLDIPVGNIIYTNSSDSIRTFFGQINIEPNSKYYLGNFVGKRIIGRKNVLHIRINDPTIPQKIYSIVENTGWASGEFIKLYPYKKEELTIY